MTPTLLTTAPAGSPDWLAARRTGIGASECAAACTGWYGTGDNAVYRQFDPRRQPRDLYHLLRGEIEPTEDNDYMAWGRFMEPSVVQFYEWKHGVKLQYPLGVYQHPQYDWMVASPDAAFDNRRGMEIKHTGYQKIKAIEECGLDAVVPEYVLQCTHQMAVMGWESVELVFLAERQLYPFTIERNERLIDLIIERESEFWSRVERGDPPPIQPEHENVSVSLRHAYPEMESHAVRLSPVAVAAWREAQTLKEQIAALERRRGRSEAIVAAEIGAASAGILGDGRAVRRKINRESVSLRETSDAGLSVVDSADGPQERLETLRRYLSQHGFMGTSTTPDRAEFVHVRSGQRVAALLAGEHENGALEKSGETLIHLGSSSVHPLDAAKLILDTMGV